MTLLVDRPVSVNEAIPAKAVDSLPTFVDIIDVPVSDAQTNPFAESDALLAHWNTPGIDEGWDTVSRAKVARWTEREQVVQENADYMAGLVSVGVVTEEQLAAFDPTAELRTSFEATDYTAITAPPTKQRGAFLSWIGHGTKTSYDLLDTPAWDNFDLRTATHGIHELTEDIYWEHVEDRLAARVDQDPNLPNDTLAFDTALVEVQSEAGSVVQMSETEKWGYTGKAGAETLPKEGSLRFSVYSAVQKGFAALGRLKPVARAQVALGNAHLKLQQLDGFSRAAAYSLAAAAGVSATVIGGYHFAGEMMPSQHDMYSAAANIMGLNE